MKPLRQQVGDNINPSTSNQYWAIVKDPADRARLSRYLEQLEYLTGLVKTAPEADSETPYASRRAGLCWAQLLKRVFQIDLTTCSSCGGPLTLSAAIEDPAVIAKILSHLGLPTRAPPCSPARTDDLFHTA